MLWVVACLNVSSGSIPLDSVGCLETLVLCFDGVKQSTAPAEELLLELCEGCQTCCPPAFKNLGRLQMFTAFQMLTAHKT